MCGLAEPERAGWLAQVEAYAQSGHKVIGCARRGVPALRLADVGVAMLAFQDLPAGGSLAPAQRLRQARFFSAEAWMVIVLAGGIASAAVVWSYLHALGVDRDVEHARAMAVCVLLAVSAGATTGLTRLREGAARWLVVATLASVGMLVQIPMFSRRVHLRPLHAADWALVASSFAVSVALTLLVASRLTRHSN